MPNKVQLGIFACLLMAFLQAPFIHTHDHAPDHDHSDGLAHAHFHLNQSVPPGPVFTAPDAYGTARVDNWFVFEGKPRLIVDVGLPECVLALAPPPVCTHGLIQPVPCNHDPPQILILRSRAPPA